MQAEKLTKEEVERLARKQLQHLDRQKEASARRRAKLKEQGKTQITLMVSVKRAEQIKEMIKILEEKDVEEFALAEWKLGKEKMTWMICYEHKKS